MNDTHSPDPETAAVAAFISVCDDAYAAEVMRTHGGIAGHIPSLAAFDHRPKLITSRLHTPNGSCDRQALSITAWIRARTDHASPKATDEDPFATPAISRVARRALSCIVGVII